MAAILRDSSVVVVRTRPRAIPLAMITMRKSTHGFPFVSYMSMGLRLAALRAAGAPLRIIFSLGELSVIMATGRSRSPKIEKEEIALSETVPKNTKCNRK